jgi:hypothetical protein
MSIGADRERGVIADIEGATARHRRFGLRVLYPGSRAGSTSLNRVHSASIATPRSIAAMELQAEALRDHDRLPPCAASRCIFADVVFRAYDWSLGCREEQLLARLSAPERVHA